MSIEIVIFCYKAQIHSLKPWGGKARGEGGIGEGCLFPDSAHVPIAKAQSRQ